MRYRICGLQILRSSDRRAGVRLKPEYWRFTFYVEPHACRLQIDKVFTDTSLKRLLKEVENTENTRNLTVLKTYILNSISSYPQNIFRI